MAITMPVVLAALAVFLTVGIATQAQGAEKPSIQELKKQYVKPKAIPYPADNPYSKEREALGKMLFFDPRISGSQVMSCATCHNPSFSWGDSLPKAVGHGHKTLGRRTPTILNLAWAERTSWDGRAGSLEEQALGPIQAEGEMNQPIEGMVKRMSVLYKKDFEKAYPGEPVTEKTIAKAIATFERGVVSGEAPFDKWIKGNESAISARAKNGFVLFNTKANCAACHSGSNFTDFGFHDIGVAGDDLGRGNVLKKIASMQYAFKTPTLRNVVERYPYMHDGSESTLEEVIEFYNLGGRVKRDSLSDQIRPLELTAAEKSDLLEFLKTLSSVDPPVALPKLPGRF